MKMNQHSRVARAAAVVGIAVALSAGGAGVAGAAPRSRMASVSASLVSTHAAAAPVQAVGKCDNVGSKHFAKTRFLFHSALGFGAFHRYIYKPLKDGGFSAGAVKRIRTFLKAGLAGVFVVHEIKEMVKFAEADKTLCKMVPNIAGITTAVQDLVSKLKGGSASEADLKSVSNMFDSVKSQAGGYGADINDRVVSIPGV